MKKRQRKKLAIGEFYRPWFAFNAELTPMGDGDQAEFVSRFIAEAEKRDLICEGAIGETELEICIDTGRLATRNAERREEFVNLVKTWPELVKIDVSELQ